MKITTKSGFKCNVKENDLKSWDYVTLSARLAKETDEMKVIVMLDDLITLVLGDQKNAFLAHIAEVNGVADTTTVIAEFKFITEMMGEQLKKSMPSQA